MSCFPQYLYYKKSAQKEVFNDTPWKINMILAAITHLERKMI